MKKLKADWSQEVPTTIQSTIFSLPRLLSKNIKIKIQRTIILPLLSVVNPDPEIRSWRSVETSLILTLPPSQKLKNQSSSIVLGGYSNIRWLMMMMMISKNVNVITHRSFTIREREKSEILTWYILLIYNTILHSYCPHVYPSH